MPQVPIRQLTFRGSVVRRAAFIALIVGHVLAAINHGHRIIAGTMTMLDWYKVGLTFLVPYTVSTISSVLALRDKQRLLSRIGGTPEPPNT